MEAIKEAISGNEASELSSILSLIESERESRSRNQIVELLKRCPPFVLDPNPTSDLAARVTTYVNDFQPLRARVPCSHLPRKMGEFFTLDSNVGELSTLVSALLAAPSSGFGVEYERVWEVFDAARETTSCLCFQRNKDEGHLLNLKCRVFVDSKRPDNITYLEDRVVFYGEERKDAAEFHLAMSELTAKVVRLPVAVYGDARFLICYAAAGSLVQFFMLRMNKQRMNKQDHPFLAPLTRRLELHDDRPYLVLVYIKLYFVLQAMREAISCGPTFELYKQQNRSWSSVKLTDDGATKIIWDWQHYCQALGVELKDMKKAYLAAFDSDKHLVGSVLGPRLVNAEVAGALLVPPTDAKGASAGKTSASKKRKRNEESDNESYVVFSQDSCSASEDSSSDRDNCYVVETIPLLAEREPCSESELRQLVYGVLKALRALHNAGLVHRDIRLDNILYNYKLQQYVLIDLEGVCADGKTPDVQLRAWDAETLTREYERKYTTRSDLQLLGLVMSDHKHLLASKGSADFMAKLLGKSFKSAADALKSLEDEWRICL